MGLQPGEGQILRERKHYINFGIFVSFSARFKKLFHSKLSRSEFIEKNLLGKAFFFAICFYHLEILFSQIYFLYYLDVIESLKLTGISAK